MTLFSLGSFLLLLPAFTCAEWVLGSSGASCTQACIGAGLQCSPKGLHEHSAATNSEREVSALMASFNESCQSHNLNYGSNGDVPAFQKSSGACYISDITRQLSTFKCDRTTSVDKHRLCWCHAASTHVAALGCAQKDSDKSSGISTGVLIWIISGNMLAFGLLCMCCGVLQRLLRKWQGKPEEPDLSVRPEDPGIFLRCPACGCPLERSEAVTATYSRVAPRTHSRHSKFSQKSSLGLCQGDATSEDSKRTTFTTVKFNDQVSEVSQSVVPSEV